MTDTRHLCDIKEGWRSCFWGDYLVMMKEDGTGEPVWVLIREIVPGETLPR